MSALAECPYCAPDEKCAVCLGAAVAAGQAAGSIGPMPPWFGELIGAAWDPMKHPRHPKGSARGGEFAPKVGDGVVLDGFEGHVTNIRENGDVVVKLEVGGTHVVDATELEAPTTFIGKQGFERGPGKVTIEGDRPRTPTTGVFANDWVELDDAVSDWETLREQRPDKEQVPVSELVPTQDQMSSVRIQEYVQELQEDGNLDELLDTVRVVEGDDGRLYIADGHNRVAAAIELGHRGLPLPVIRPAVARETFTPTTFPAGEFDPHGPVKFWPRAMGAYSGFKQDAPYGPFWKAVIDNDGNEQAFWFASPQGHPHHDDMISALMRNDAWPPVEGYTHDVAGYGTEADLNFGADSEVFARLGESMREIPRRHRRDIRDANEFLEPNQKDDALAAAAWDESKHPRHPKGEREGGRFMRVVTVGSPVIPELYGELKGTELEERLKYAYQDSLPRGGGQGKPPTPSQVVIESPEQELMVREALERIEERATANGDNLVAWPTRRLLKEERIGVDVAPPAPPPVETIQGGPFATDMPSGELDRGGKVVFWPRTLGHYDGEPYWKGIVDEDGNERAFWFTDPRGRPHHDVMARTLFGDMEWDPASYATETIAGTGDVADGGEDEGTDAIVRRHRKDIDDARQMTRALAAAAAEPEELTVEQFNEAVEEAAAELDKYEPRLEAIYRRAMKQLGRAMAARFVKLAPDAVAAAGVWDESKHPRDPGGEGGGQWVPFPIGRTEGLPPGFPDGIFEPGDDVKFWPKKMGAYFENGRDLPMWKAILDDDGNEIAFWFVDPSSYPHHGHMQRALGIPNNYIAAAGWGNNADTDWMAGRDYPDVAIEGANEMPIRHRRDISDAAEMVTDETRLVAAAGPPPADWSPPTVAELLAVQEEAWEKAAAEARVVQIAAFETMVLGVLGRIGISFEVRAILTQTLLNGLGARAIEMIEGIRVPVARAIANSYLNGLSVPQTRDAIMEAVDGLTARQATMLARNDLVGLANGGSLTSARLVREKFPEVGLAYKEWLSTPDERTRPTHVEAMGQRVPLETPFTVGEAHLAYPGDPTGPDAEVINCRCTLIYKQEPALTASSVVEKIQQLTAAFVESQHPRDPGGEGGGEFIAKGATGVDEGEEEEKKKPGKRLKLREPDGTTKKQTEATVKKNVQLVADDVADFYGADRKSATTFEPEATAAWDVEATTRILPSQMELPNPKQEVFYGDRLMEKAREPDYGVFPYRQIAHEAIHANVSGQRFTSGFYHDYEEGAAEILSIHYWNERGQPFDHRDAVRVDGRWTEPGAESLAHSVVYREQVADLMRRSASSVGWDREKVVGEVLRVVKGDSNVKLKFRDGTDPEFRPPEGVGDDAVSMIHWLIAKPVTAAAWDEAKHPRDPGGEGGGQFIPKGTTAPGGEPEKSEGHLLFADKWEYFVFGDDVLRAPLDAPIRADVPYRNGARFEFPVSQIATRQAQGVYPFTQQTIEGVTNELKAPVFETTELVGLEASQAVRAIDDELRANWPMEPPRRFAREAVQSIAMGAEDRELLWTVRRDGELIAVSSAYATVEYPDGPYVHANYGGAIKQGGMPMFRAMLQSAAERGEGLRFAAGTDEAKQLYDRMGFARVPKSAIPRYVITPADVKILQDDLLAFVRDPRPEHRDEPISLAAAVDDEVEWPDDWTIGPPLDGLVASVDVVCVIEWTPDGLVAAAWDPTKHPRHPAGSPVGGEFAPKPYYYGASMAREGGGETGPVIGYNAFRMQRGFGKGSREGATIVGPIRETIEEATLDARMAFEEELAADAEAIIRREREHVQRVDNLRIEAGQGGRHTRTTEPQEGPDGEIMLGTRDALAIQAAEVGIPVREYDEWTTTRMQELTSKAAGARIAIRTDSIDQILEAEQYLNAHDKAHQLGDQRSTRSDGYLETRGAMEQRLFGSHPVYGYVALDDEDLSAGLAKAFGKEAKITLKDDVRARTTVTYSDSMFIDAGADYTDVIPRKIDEVDHRAVASWMNLKGVEAPIAWKGMPRNPEPQMTQAETVKFEQRVRDAERSMLGQAAEPGEMRAIEWNRWLDQNDYRPWPVDDFIEAQIHGGVYLDDIERIDFLEAPSAKTIARLNELGLAWTVGGPDGS